MASEKSSEIKNKVGKAKKKRARFTNSKNPSSNIALVSITGLFFVIKGAEVGLFENYAKTIISPVINYIYIMYVYVYIYGYILYIYSKTKYEWIVTAVDFLASRKS